jgi:ABC-2 type transport system ATP-binding protein
MIRIENVTKKFDDFIAVDDVNLNIQRAHIHGLLGPNGAGKTTLIRSLIGLYEITEGEIKIDGELIGRDNYRIKSRIGVVSQHINLDKELTVDENLEFAGRLYKINKKEIKSRKEELLRFFDLTKSRDKQIKKISGGMKRKLMIAKALIHEPDVIILDEPTVGIDVKSRKEIWQMLIKLREEGKTILLTTHYIEEAEYLCDMISLIDAGRIKTTNTTKSLVRGIGNFCVEYVIDNKILYDYFEKEESAKEFSKSLSVHFTIRKTNLEDVFQGFIDKKAVRYGD